MIIYISFKLKVFKNDPVDQKSKSHSRLQATDSTNFEVQVSYHLAYCVEKTMISDSRTDIHLAI